MADQKECKCNPNGANIWVAVGLILLGLIFLLDNFDIINASNIWRLWPAIFIAIGLLKLKSANRQDRASAWVFLVLGTAFLLASLHILDWPCYLAILASDFNSNRAFYFFQTS